MGVVNSKIAGLIIVALAALIVIGCSSENPTAPAQSALRSSSLEDPSDSRPGIPEDKYEFVYTGRISTIDRSNRSFEFDDKAGLTILVDRDAKIYALPDYEEIPFGSRSADYETLTVPAALEPGATATVYGEFKGDETVIAKIVLVEAARSSDELVTNGFEVGDPNDDRDYEVVFTDRLASVDFRNRSIVLADRMNLQVYVEQDAPVVYMPSRLVYSFEPQGSEDDRSSDQNGIFVENAQIGLYGFFKSDELFIAQRVDVWEVRANEELIANSIVISDPSDIDRNYDFQFEGRVSAIDYEQRSFELAEKEGLLFQVVRDARIISIPDGENLNFVANDARSSSDRNIGNAIEEGSKVVAYGTFKDDENFIVELMEVYNSSLIGDPVIVGDNNR
ncbi:MAG: hypothetical protein GWO41_06050 [candidate division Zixibacteria bacterium]|nr:hypothetical protein [candidate division Zixibacteria bacterium]NIR62760.1 hypothetical protein [candidate division Zixibacteria bacterium]NIS15843.1 hypothetical protein [candidate division Zixibacteria bacterium]NIS44831.1 hypothetical protein [candidate division Zixibacteria bacterium]NIT52303.1 hypothetical protein [candidate division Zixibacteria bacterium]